MEIKELKPSSIWHYFDAITQVPRPSKKEERIREFLLAFAREQNLAAQVDKTGNVVITKEATPVAKGLLPLSCKLIWIWCARRTAM